MNAVPSLRLLYDIHWNRRMASSVCGRGASAFPENLTGVDELTQMSIDRRPRSPYMGRDLGRMRGPESIAVTLEHEIERQIR